MPPVRNARLTPLDRTSVRITWEAPGTGMHVVSCKYAVRVVMIMDNGARCVQGGLACGCSLRLPHGNLNSAYNIATPTVERLLSLSFFLFFFGAATVFILTISNGNQNILVVAR